MSRTPYAVAALGLAAPLLLAGCLSTPRPDPALDLPAAYSDRDEWGTSAGVQPSWWRDFGSDELTGLVEETQSGNLDIAVAVARVKDADAQLRIAGSALLPLIDASADLSRSRAATLTGRGGATDRTLYSPAASASYVVDFWGRNRSLAQAAEQLAAASRFDRDTVALTAAATTATTYVRILAAYDRLRIARQNLGSARRVLGIVRERLEVGTATALDLAQQETVVARLRADIPPLEQTAEQQTAALAALLGRAPERLRVGAAGMASLRMPRIGAGAPSALLARRPDIAAAQAQLEAAHGNVDAAKAAFFPTISLTTQGGFESLALSSLLTSGAGFYAIGAGLTQPIFQGFRLQGQYEQQQARQDQALQAYRGAVVNAFADVEQALIAMRQLGRQEQLERDALASSRRAYDIAEQRLREGTVDLVTVLNTQTALFQSEDQLTQVRQARFLAAISLYQALGGGWSASVAAADKPAP